MDTPIDRTGFIYEQHDCINERHPSFFEDQLHDDSGNSLWRCPTCGTIWEPIVEDPGGGLLRIVDWHLVAAPARDAMIHEIYQDFGMEGPLS